MSNHVKELLSHFSGQMAIVTIPAIYIRFTGSMESAALLSQMLYWSDRTKDPEGWFHKSYSEWESEIALSEYQVRKHSKKFAEQGFLEIKLKKINGAPKVHYRVNWDDFSESILKFLKNGNLKNLGNLDSEETKESIPEKLQNPIYKDPKTTYKDYQETTSKECEADSEKTHPALSPAQEKNIQENKSEPTPHPVNSPSSEQGNVPRGDRSRNNFGLEDREWAFYEAPWHESVTTYKESVIEAVFQSDKRYYSVNQDGVRRNDRHIKTALQKLDRKSQVYHGDPRIEADVLTARQDLLDYWKAAQAIAPIGEGGSGSADWRSHPQFDEWSKEILSRGRAVFCHPDGRSRDETRVRFYQWFEASGLLEVSA